MYMAQEERRIARLRRRYQTAMELVRRQDLIRVLTWANMLTEHDVDALNGLVRQWDSTAC